jgi:hypothetical protein
MFLLCLLPLLSLENPGLQLQWNTVEWDKPAVWQLPKNSPASLALIDLKLS